MAVNLTVILGSGAARDVVTPGSNQVKIESRGEIFRPPITADLIHTNRRWEDEYMKFPAVASVIEDLRNKAGDKRTSTDIEDLLRELKESPKQHRRASFREFTLYLQHFFTAVTERYCRKPSNYMTLIGRIFDLDLDKVIFITTNYDLLFDKALHHHPATEANFSISDGNMSKYITASDWVYIKLHGSIDWGRKIKKNSIKNEAKTLPGLVDNVRKLGDSLENSLEDEIIKDSSFNQEERELIYPAISVPVGENKFNCRGEHIESLKTLLDYCQHFLIIGFSGYDNDILELLDKKRGGFGKVLFVSGSRTEAMNVREQFGTFGDLGHKLQLHANTFDGKGFDEFIKDGLDGYLNKLR